MENPNRFKFADALDRMVGLFSPKAELKRRHYRAAAKILRGHGKADLAAAKALLRYDGASRGRRLANWSTGTTSANAETLLGLDALRSRTHDLVRNSPYAAAAIDIHEANMVGTGIIPQALPTTKRVDDLYAHLSLEYLHTTACDAEGRHNFFGLQACGARSLAETGEILARKRFRKKRDGLPIPMQIQMLEPEHIDTLKNENGKGNRKIIQGVEFDGIGRRVAYWIFPEHPGEGFNFRPQDSIRIPANEIIHAFDTLRIGQVRGIPWSASCLMRHKDFDDGVDAQLLRFKIANLFVAFYHDIEAAEELRPGDSDDEFDIEKLEPGMIESLPAGKTIEWNKPPGVTGFRDLNEITTMEIAKGWRVTYEQLTGNLSNVSFSSGRMGWIEFATRNSINQRKTLIPQFCNRVWEWMADVAQQTTRVPHALPATWTPPRRAMIDPIKETAALKAQIRAGLNSLPNALRELGYDPEALVKDAAKFWEIVDKHGLLLETDLRADKGRLILPEPEGKDKDPKKTS